MKREHERLLYIYIYIYMRTVSHTKIIKPYLLSRDDDSYVMTNDCYMVFLHVCRGDQLQLDCLC
jgi:hypothetical protein